MDYKKAIKRTADIIAACPAGQEEVVAATSTLLVSEIFGVDSDQTFEDIKACVAEEIINKRKKAASSSDNKGVTIPCKIEGYSTLERAKMLLENNALTFINLVPTPENVEALVGLMLQHNALSTKDPVRVYVTGGDYVNEVAKTEKFDPEDTIVSIMCPKGIEYLAGLLEVKEVFTKMDDTCLWYEDVLSEEQLAEATD